MIPLSNIERNKNSHTKKDVSSNQETNPIEPYTLSNLSYDKDRYRLKRLNIMMSILHASLAIVTLVTPKRLSLDAPVFRFTIDLNYTMDHSENIASISANEEITSVVEAFGVKLKALDSGLPLVWLTFSFFALTSFFHFFVSILIPKTYFFCLDNKCNPFRWIEYSITASLMWLIFAHMFAFVDLNSLILSTTMICVTMFSAIQCEFVARPDIEKDDWTLPLMTRLVFLLPGLVLYGTPAILLCISLLTNINGTLPAFVLPSVISLLGLYESFAIVLIWQQCNRPSQWIYGEYAYQVLSLVSKALLGLVLIFNIFIYEDYACIFESDFC